MLPLSPIFAWAFLKVNPTRANGTYYGSLNCARMHLNQRIDTYPLALSGGHVRGSRKDLGQNAAKRSCRDWTRTSIPY